jgi:hypothetical protein
MAIYPGLHYTQVFAIQNEDGSAVDLTGMEFEADFRESVDAEDTVITLTSADSGFSIESPASDGRLRMSLTAEQTLTLPEGKLVFDVLQSNASPGPDFLFRATIKVKQTVTRDE